MPMACIGRTLVLRSWMPAKSVKAPRLGAVRESAFLSQRDLAKAAGVSRNTVARMERGEGAQYGTIRKLALALQVEPRELLAPSGA